MPRLAPLLVLALSFSAIAQEKNEKKDPAPKVLYAVPLVAKPGMSQRLALRGKNLAAVKEVKVAGAAGASVKVLGAKAVAVPNNYPADRVGDSEVEVELDLPKDAKTGRGEAHGRGDWRGIERVRTPPAGRDWPSPTRRSRTTDSRSREPWPCQPPLKGRSRASAMWTSTSIDGKKGDKVRIAVLASRFGSPVDAIITVHDSMRAVLDVVDDIAGAAHSDPELVLTLPGDGMYYISVIDAHDLGGANFGYRLVVRKE